MVLAVAVFAVVCFMLYSINYSTIENRKNEPVRIAVTQWPGFFHIYAAARLGFFKKEGANAELVLCDGSEEMVGMIKRGEVDAIAGPLSDAMLLSARGTPVKVVYATDYSDSADVVIAAPDIKSPADLKGKTISFDSLNSFSHIFIINFLRKNGLKDSEVILKRTPPPQLLDELEAGRVTAGHARGPVIGAALAKGFRIIERAGDSPGVITNVLSVRKDIAEEKSGEIEAIVRALVKSRRYFDSRHTEGIAAAAKYLRKKPEELEMAYEGVHFLSYEDNVAAFKDTDSPASLYNSSKFILRQLNIAGQAEDSLKPEMVLDPQFIFRAAKAAESQN